MIIPGEVIALATFPGTILHEIAHRFFCDVTNVPVYAIRYFIPLSTTSGCVIHERTDSLVKAFLIGCGPLIINSLVCMVLTMPYGTSYIFGTSFIVPQGPVMNCTYWFVTWFGFCAGISAIPSNQDVTQLIELSNSALSRLFTYPIIGIVYIMNLDYIGFWLRAGYAMCLATVLPMFFLF